MKVRELMTSDVSACQLQDNLTQAVTVMWQRDCGVVPVVDEHQRVVGMVTDRDIAIAAATKNRLASNISVGEIIYGAVKSCDPNDDVEDALKIMRKHQLRRLPVTSKDGVLLGIISISDLLRHTKGKDKVPAKKLLKTLREISTFRPVFLHEIAAEEPPDENNTAEDGDVENVPDDEPQNIETIEQDKVEPTESDDKDNDNAAVAEDAQI
jgi:CBS domain-containing protein